MARVLIRSGAKPTAVLYAVDQAVGGGCPNRRDDVLLVQFLLKALATRTVPETGESYAPAKLAALAVDGICGTQTTAYLRHFQGIVNRIAQGSRAGAWEDGMVNPVPPGQPFGRIHGRLYTIIRLNTEYRTLFGEAQTNAIETDPNFPTELRAKLFAWA